MWKELGLDSVKKGFDSFVKKAVDRVDGDRRESLVFPARDELGCLVSYTLREAPDQVGCNLEIESDDVSIFRVPVTDRPLTVGVQARGRPLQSRFSPRIEGYRHSPYLQGRVLFVRPSRSLYC